MNIIIPRKVKILDTNLDIGDQVANKVGPNTDDIDVDPPTWTPTAYNVGDEVSSDTDTSAGRNVNNLKNVYVCIRPHTGLIGDVPSPTPPANDNNPAGSPFANHPDIERSRIESKRLTNPTPTEQFWVLRRAQNRYVPVDQRISISTGRDDPNEIDLNSVQGRAGRSTGLWFDIAVDRPINTIGLLNISASGVEFSFKRDSFSVDEPVSFVDIDGINTWHQYFFNDISFPRVHIFENIPVFSHREILPADERLRISIRNPNGFAGIGQIVAGIKVSFGNGDEADVFGITGVNNSTRNPDEFGVSYNVKRPATKNLRAKTTINVGEMASVERLLSELLEGDPAIFYSSDSIDYGDRIFGVLNNYDIEIHPDNLSKATVTMTIHGLI